MKLAQLVRLVLAIPSPSLLLLGPKHWGAAERRYVALRKAAKAIEEGDWPSCSSCGKELGTGGGDADGCECADCAGSREWDLMCSDRDELLEKASELEIRSQQFWARVVAAEHERDEARAAVWREAAEYMEAQAGAMGRLRWPVTEQSYLKSADYFRAKARQNERARDE